MMTDTEHKLRTALYKAGICPDCFGEITHHVDEPIASCEKCGPCEDTTGPSTIQKLRMQVTDLEGAMWRIAPNVYSLPHGENYKPDPFEGPGETYHDAFMRVSRERDALLNLCGAEQTVEGAQTWMEAERDLHNMALDEQRAKWDATRDAHAKENEKNAIRITILEMALRECAGIFTLYRKHHAAKGTEEADHKAMVNGQHANCIERILTGSATAFENRVPTE
jgi:hypothetical protein